MKKTPPTDDSAPKPKKAPPSSKGGVVPAKGGGAKGKKGGKGGGAAPGIGEPPDLPEPNIAVSSVVCIESSSMYKRALVGTLVTNYTQLNNYGGTQR